MKQIRAEKYIEAITYLAYALSRSIRKVFRWSEILPNFRLLKNQIILSNGAQKQEDRASVLLLLIIDSGLSSNDSCLGFTARPFVLAS
jgi:hypothetical protein